MQYQHAKRLGMLHQQLGLKADARMFFQIITDGVSIWDLDTGDTYIVVRGNDPVKGRLEVPPLVKTIIAASDEDLKTRWLSTMGWGDERETVLSELSFRGIDVLKLEGIR